MKRWLLLIIMVIVVVFSAAALRHKLKTEARMKREATYQSTLRTYSQKLRPGLTRKEVETYLRARNITFKRMGWFEERSAFADLVGIGQEDPPWYCSENYIYVAFEFAATESHQPWEAYDTDVLKRVGIVRPTTGCL